MHVFTYMGQGLEYAGDYSANFSNRSLVDKIYIDDWFAHTMYYKYLETSVRYILNDGKKFERYCDPNGNWNRMLNIQDTLSGTFLFPTPITCTGKDEDYVVRFVDALNDDDYLYNSMLTSYLKHTA